MKALIDGDILRYRIGFACQTTFHDVWEDWDDDGRMHTRTFRTKKDLTDYIKMLEDGTYEVQERIVAEPVAFCLHSVKVQLNSIIQGAKANEYKILLTGKNNFRDELVDYYKANRDRGKRPEHYDAITDYLIEQWGAKLVHNREADDALSILQWKDYLDKDNRSFHTIICSIDKDLDIVPGWHYNFVKDETYWITEVEGLRNFYMQMLTGDVSDNIPGISKITGNRRRRGEMEEHQAKIDKMDTDEEMWTYVYYAYIAEFMAMDENEWPPVDFSAVREAVWEKLREIGKLLWMQRTVDDDWEPPV